MGRIFREQYQQEQSATALREQRRPPSRARDVFWVSWGLAALLTVLADVFDVDGPVMLALRLAVAVLWVVSALRWLSEVMARRRAKANR